MIGYSGHLTIAGEALVQVIRHFAAATGPRSPMKP